MLDEVYVLLGQFIANPELAAERTQQINLGIEWSKDEQLQVSLNGWHSRVEGTFARLSANLIVECALGLAEHCPRGVRLLPAGIDFDPELGLGLIPRFGDRLPQVQYGVFVPPSTPMKKMGTFWFGKCVQESRLCVTSGWARY